MKTVISVLAIVVLAASSAVSAAVSDREFAQLRSDFAALAQRLEALEAENVRLKSASEQTTRDVSAKRKQVAGLRETKSPAAWADRITLKGDFRYRYESIDVENTTSRDRSRLRARAAVIAQADDNIEIGLGIASGGDDPLSSNQTLGNAGTTKDLRLDLAYVDWTAGENFHVIGGKFKNIWYRPQKHGLIWDGDYNPEGLAATFNRGVFFASAAGTWLESDRKKSNTEFSWGAQAGFKGKLGGAAVVAGVGYYDMDTADNGTFYGDPDEFFGNSFSCENPATAQGCTYIYDYKEIELFADVSMNIGDMPVSVFADYVVNKDADENDTGYALGFKLGKAKARGSWEATYIWQDLEADAVLGALSNSDFGGGGTDNKGHILQGGYAVNPRWTFNLTYFRNETGGNRGADSEYDRVQLDASFKY